MTEQDKNYFENLGISVHFFYEGNPCIHIHDSNLMCERKIRTHIIEKIMSLPEFSDLRRAGFNRSKQSMLREWSGHNFLYKIGYKRQNTAHVDIDNNEPFWRKIIYGVIDAFMR